jgi:hypothetical protein
MEMSLDSIYKDEIEAIKDEPNFEALGDAKYLDHESDDARLLWAFYRPSGSDRVQVADKNVMVAIMAFNHSRLGAWDRFSILNPKVLHEASLRTKIRNRSRMLFRAMIDDDFGELIKVLALAPDFLDLACDQMINGRIWNETYANATHASSFIDIASEVWNTSLAEGLVRRLQPLADLSFEDAKAYLETLIDQVQNLHTFIKMHFVKAYEVWLEKQSLHPLQRIVIEKRIAFLKETHEPNRTENFTDRLQSE